jgi:hypothetical protein
MITARIATKSLGLGFLFAIAIIVIGFFLYNVVSPLSELIWAPGEILVLLSNQLCPPSGVACVLGEVSQGAHHKWFFICLFSCWWLVMSLFTA